MAVWILRYGHRRFRDQRATTHVALCARALGAAGILIAGEEDEELVERLRALSKRWGGDFKVEHTDDWMKTAEAFKRKGGCFVHLTMYGLRLQDAIADARAKAPDCLVLVGSQKVPTEAYDLADFNIAVTNQPHSEISSLALFLDRYFEGTELEKPWAGEVSIQPSNVGKSVSSSKKRRQV